MEDIQPFSQLILSPRGLCLPCGLLRLIASVGERSSSFLVVVSPIR